MSAVPPQIRLPDMLNAGDPQLHAELRPAASGRARRAAPDPGDGRRGRAARRPAHRPAASRHREAGRVQAVQPVDRLHGSPRLRVDDVQRARLRARDRDADGDRGAGARAVDPHDVRRDHPHPEPPDVGRLERARPRRDGGVPVRVPRARGADGLLRGGLRRAHARDLLPPGRRLPRPARAHAEVQANRRGARAPSSSASTSGAKARCSISSTRSPRTSRSASTSTRRCSPTTASGSSAPSASAWCRRSRRWPGA